MPFIYELVSGQLCLYIGRTSQSLKERERKHRRQDNTSSSRYIPEYTDWEMKLIEECDESVSPEREYYWYDIKKPLYNKNIPETYQRRKTVPEIVPKEQKPLIVETHRMEEFMTLVTVKDDHWLSPVSLQMNRKTMKFFKNTGEDRLHRISYKLFYPERNIKCVSLTQKCSEPRCCRGDHYMEGYDNTYAIQQQAQARAARAVKSAARCPVGGGQI